jgi:hypothetical protein
MLVEVSSSVQTSALTQDDPRPLVALHLSPAMSELAVQMAQADVLKAGFDLSSTSIASFGVIESEVRFFHPDDAPEAERMAEALGAVVRDYSAFKPAPPPGTLEVWLARQD